MRDNVITYRRGSWDRPSAAKGAKHAGTSILAAAAATSAPRNSFRRIFNSSPASQVSFLAPASTGRARFRDAGMPPLEGGAFVPPVSAFERARYHTCRDVFPRLFFWYNHYRPADVASSFAPTWRLSYGRTSSCEICIACAS